MQQQKKEASNHSFKRLSVKTFNSYLIYFLDSFIFILIENFSRKEINRSCRK
jgi:hypothetical protein